MYSYADRLRAVQLYIKLGKRVGATIRELGYPTKNALKDWYREYERHHDLPAGYVRTKRWYSDEQKRVAVERYLSHGRCLAETRKVLGRVALAANLSLELVRAALGNGCHPCLRDRLPGGKIPPVQGIASSTAELQQKFEVDEKKAYAEA